MQAVAPKQKPTVLKPKAKKNLQALSKVSLVAKDPKKDASK